MRHKQPLMPSMRNKASITAREAAELLKLKKGARGQGQKTAYPTKRQCVITGKINLFVMHDTAGADNRN
jgi:hypothetical protein